MSGIMDLRQMIALIAGDDINIVGHPDGAVGVTLTASAGTWASKVAYTEIITANTFTTPFKLVGIEVHTFLIGGLTVKEGEVRIYNGNLGTSRATVKFGTNVPAGIVTPMSENFYFALPFGPRCQPGDPVYGMLLNTGATAGTCIVNCMFAENV